MNLLLLHPEDFVEEPPDGAGEGRACIRGRRFEYTNTLRHHFHADTVTGNKSNFQRFRHRC